MKSAKILITVSLVRKCPFQGDVILVIKGVIFSGFEYVKPSLFRAATSTSSLNGLSPVVSIKTD